MKILAPFLLLLGILPLMNCTRQNIHDLQTRARQRREVPYVRTVRRASLHELLKMNGNVASVSENSEGRRQVDHPPPTSDINDNRRVLVVGDADEPPNFIDDDRMTSDKKFDGYQTNDQDKPNENPAQKTNIGAPVTKYASPFSPASAPSYADPDLLTAVMKQADNANFRFPSQNNPVQYKRDPTTKAVLKRAPAVSSTKNDENPYKKFFPPQFHELLDIPMHIYRNGSAKLNSSKTSEPKLQAPRITGGYSNTNINNPSNENQKQERESVEVREDNAGERYANYKPAVRRPIKPTTTVNQQHSQNGSRQKPNYTEVVRKTSGVEDRIPPTDPSRLLEKKTERPSLQFRTKAPTAVIPTEEPLYKEIQDYTESTSLDFTLPSEDERDVGTSIKSPNRFHIQAGIRVPSTPPLSSQTNFKPAKGDVGIQTSINLDDLGFGSKISDDLGKSKEKFYKPVEIIPQKTSPFTPTEVIRRKNLTNRPKETIQRIDPLPKQNSSPPLYSPPVYNPPTYNPKSNDKELSKSPFKPSKVDPYLSSGIAIASSFDQPITLKPDYHPYGSGQSNVYQSNNAYNIYDKQGSQTSNVYESQVSPADPIFYTYNTQGSKLNIPTKRKENMQPFNRPNPYQEDNFPTNFPFSRHPTVDKHTFERKFHSGAYSPYQKNDDLPVKRADELYSDLNGSLRPPPSFNQGHHALPLERPYNVPQQRRRSNRPQRQRPSLLKNFGFFKRRSGVSGPNSDVNSLRSRDSEKEASKYLLTKGPIPYNAQKVTVIGPFKNPPIGAPAVHPHHIPVQGDSLLPTLPSTKLIPPSPFQSPVQSNEIDVSNREPSFKVINFPKEDGLTINQGYTVSADANTGTMNDQKARSDKNIEKSSIIYGQQNKLTNPKYIASNSTIVDVSSKFNVGSDKKDRMAIIHQASLPGQYKEVSEADKERIIAAKFVFPRAHAVRRSGSDSHVIPIPVPLLSTSGNQIHQMQRIILPKLPSKRGIFFEPQRKISRSVDDAPLLLTYGPRVNDINPNSNVIFRPTHPIDAKQTLPSKTLSSDSSTSESQNSENNVKTNNEEQLFVVEEVLVTPAPQINSLMKITPYPTSSFINEKIFEEPQSFVEPTNSAIMYGDWKVVGESKVNPKGELDPVVSFVVENTPKIMLKTPESVSNDKEESFEKDKDNFPVEVANGQDSKDLSEKQLKSAEIILGRSKEEKMVKFTSLLNIEGSDGSINSFLLQPPKVN